MIFIKIPAYDDEGVMYTVQAEFIEHMEDRGNFNCRIKKSSGTSITCGISADCVRALIEKERLRILNNEPLGGLYDNED